MPGRIVPSSAGVRMRSPILKNTFIKPALFDIAVLGAVEPQDLVEPVFARGPTGEERGGVVGRGLGLADPAMGCSAGEFLFDLESQPRAAGPEIGSDRAGQDDHAEGGRGPDFEVLLGAEDDRADVERIARPIRHPVAIDPDQRLQPVNEEVLVDFGDAHPAARSAQPGGVALGPEQPDRPVDPEIGLQPLEHHLAVVHRHHARLDRERPVRQDRRLSPGAVAVDQREHVIRKHLAEDERVQV